MVNNSKLYKIYKKLYDIGKNINENVNAQELYDIACDFTTNELDFDKCIIFEHDDSNGWFKVVKSKGYDNPVQLKILSIINLLLSGEVIEYLRVKGIPIVHTVDNPKKEVESLLKSLFLDEAYFELFGGDSEVPYGLIIVGNQSESKEENSSSILNDNESFLMLALGNFMVQLSNTINNIIFYNNWREEKDKLEENIEIRTKELEEQKRAFEAIYRTTKDGIAILDIETTAFLDANPAYCEMTGYTKEEILRTSCMKLSIEEDKQRSAEALAEVVKKGYITDFTKSCIKKDGTIIIVSMSISLMDDKKRVLISSKDITKKKEMEKELQEMNKYLEIKVQKEVEKNRKTEFQLLEQSKNASMGEMIGNIAHQWRQPLSAITTLASTVKLNDQLGILETDEIDEKMDKIVDKANYLSKTIDTFRNFLKADNLEYKEFVLESTVERSLQIVESTMKDLHIKLINNIDLTKNSKLMGVQSELSQVIINILNNGKDILKEKKIDEPWIQLDLKNEDNNYIISIEDNGGGIPKEVMPKIFDPYFTTKHQSQGTGLGLHMSYRIITESFKGKLYVHNTTNGAKFFIKLPI